MTNPFYEAAVNHMANQLAYLEKLVGRPLTDDEKGNPQEVFDNLHPRNQEEFLEKLGPLL